MSVAPRQTTTGLPQAAFALALASLPGAGPASLRAALEGRDPSTAWAAVCDGAVCGPAPGHSGGAGPSPVAERLPLPGAPPAGATRRRVPWQELALRDDVASRWEAARQRGIGVTWRGHDAYPARLADDPEAPAVLCWQGDLGCLDRPTVAVVGTRHCTPAGRAVAEEMARELAAAGVCVVSGLALGIDGAAHRGALAALGPQSTGGPDGARPPGGVTAGVAASGVDVPYPRQHRALWAQVARDGVVLGETPPGRPAQAWRFPARNRIIAGLADMVVVVESFEAGGSLLTVDAALARGVDVRAVPGPVHSPAAAGTNRLLVDGAPPVRHAGDVLDGLGLTVAGAHSGTGGGDHTPGPGALAPSERRVLGAVGWAPTVLGRVVDRAGVSVGATLAALRRLEREGFVTAGDGWWVRRPVRQGTG